MFDIDKTPETNEEKEDILRIVSKQSQEVLAAKLIYVHCPCGRLTNIYFHAFRCFSCGVIFCRECAERHFKVEHNCQHGINT
jgi:hypothetical protein